MMQPRNRREFLRDVGKGMLLATAGSVAAENLALSPACAAEEGPDALTFGALEPLVALMQETPPDRLQLLLVQRLSNGSSLKELTAAAALANARSFGGEHYIGFHTMMALSPAYHMAAELPKERQALPILKVLYRNAAGIQEWGGRKNETMGKTLPAPPPGQGPPDGASLRAAIRRKDMTGAESIFTAASRGTVNEAFNELLVAVQDQAEVHRVVLPSRAWDLLEIVGPEHAQTMLRQSVRFCVRSENGRVPQWNEVEDLLPRLMEQHRFVERTPGMRTADDAWVEKLGMTIFKGPGVPAAEAAAAMMAEGFAPDTIHEAIALATNRMVLCDPGRTPRWEGIGKPAGSVHGDSEGVHASDAANAWRNMTRISNPRNAFACTLVAAYMAGLDRSRNPDMLSTPPLPIDYHLNQVRTKDPAQLLGLAETAIRQNMQGMVCAVVHKYGELGHPSRPMFDLMLKYAVSEDGSLHAEKYYRTASLEFAAARPAFKLRHLVALARYTASEFGRPAPGYAEACKLLKV